MYLAKLKSGPTTSYQIRQSYETEKNSFNYRIVFDLGDKPRRFIQPFADHIVLFDDNLRQAVCVHAGENCETVLEQLLQDFLPQAAKQRLAMFRGRTSHRSGPLTEADKKAIAAQVHLFDRRRLFYLRYGAVDQSRLARLHEKCCRPLLGQSRDEREFYFIAEEKALQPGQYLQYVYAIFNLQRYFRQSFAPWLPESLAFEEIAEHFEQELCLLNRDGRFWQKEQTGYSLHHHLTRYLLMFFDYPPDRRSFFADFAESFMAGHRSFRWPEKKTGRSAEKISALFATPF